MVIWLDGLIVVTEEDDRECVFSHKMKKSSTQNLRQGRRNFVATWYHLASPPAGGLHIRSNGALPLGSTDPAKSQMFFPMLRGDSLFIAFLLFFQNTEIRPKTQAAARAMLDKTNKVGTLKILH